MPESQPGAARSSWLACGGVFLSILACYGTLALIAVLSLLGITLAINVHVWAAVIVLFAIVALLGTLFIVAAMYASGFLDSRLGLGSRAVELLGFAALLIAAIWGWRLRSNKKAPL